MHNNTYYLTKLCIFYPFKTVNDPILKSSTETIPFSKK